MSLVKFCIHLVHVFSFIFSGKYLQISVRNLKVTLQERADDQRRGSGMFIPHPDYFHPGSRISSLGIRIQQQHINGGGKKISVADP